MNYEQLKNSILQEAIEGRLVPQDPNEEPASKLLDRIAAEKARLVREKNIKKDKNASRIFRSNDGHWMERFEDKKREEVCIDKEIPFDIPESWEWCRINNLFDQSSGKQQSSTSKGGGKPQKFITTSNLYWGYFVLDKVKIMNFSDYEIESCSATKGDLLVCEGGAGYGRAAIWDYNYNICLQNHIHRLRPYLDGFLSHYVYYLIYFLKETNRLKSVGTAMPGLSANRLKSILVPLPPLQEQRRIVSKLETVLPKVKDFGIAQQKLDSLNAQLPERLKASILQEAIEGRLVKQNPSDEPASALLDRIHEEKVKLVKEKKVKKDKNESRIYRTVDGHWMERFEDKKREEICIDKEIPFDIPEIWEWQRFKNVCIHNPPVDGDDNKDAAFIPMALIDEGVKGTYTFQTKKWKEIKNGFRRFQNGDFAFAKITPCFQNGKSILPHNLPNGIGAGTTELYVVRPFNNTILIKYIFYFVKSPYFMLQAKYKGTAGQQRVLNQYVLDKLIPVPPIQEQHRIVERIDSILLKINKLK